MYGLPPAPLSVNSLSHSLSGITGVSGSTCAEIELIGLGEEVTCFHRESHLSPLEIMDESMDELIGSNEPSIEHHLSSETHSDIAR